MTAPITPHAIARRFAAAIAAARRVTAFAQTHYGKPFTVQIGADMRRPPSEDDAPCIALFPDAGHTGPQRHAASAELGLVVCLADAGWCARDDGVIEMCGLARLAELCPLLEQAMRDSLPKARMQEVSTEFDIMQFPLCLALMAITVDESLPIGRR